MHRNSFLMAVCFFLHNNIDDQLVCIFLQVHIINYLIIKGQYKCAALQFDIFQPISSEMSQDQQSISLLIQKPFQQQQKLRQIIKDYELLTNVSQNRLDIYMVVNKTYLNNLIVKRETPKVSNDIKTNCGTNCIIFQNIEIQKQKAKVLNQKLNQIKGNIHFLVNPPIDMQIKIFLGKKSLMNISHNWLTLNYKQSGIWRKKDLRSLQNQRQQNFTYSISYDSIADLSEPNLLMNASFRRQRQSNYDHLGIINEGNTCYVNSFIQILFYLKPIRKIIIESKTDNRLISALRQLFIELLEVQEKKPVSLQNFIDNYQKFNQKPRRQQDVQQFMLHFINQLQLQFPQMKQFWQGDCTYIVKSKDLQKPYKSANKEKFNQIDIHMADTKGNFFSDIKQSLISLIKQEEVQESIQNDQYGKIQVNKERTFQNLPAILFLNLKRYEYNRQKKRLTKILCPIKYYPRMNFSDLISDVTPGNEQYIQDQQYVLYAVIVHKGESPLSGHYFSFVNTSLIPQKPLWYQFNDSFVQPTDEQTVLEFTGTKQRDIVLQKNYQKFIETQVQTNQSSYLLVYLKFNDFSNYQKTTTKVPKQYLKEKLLKKAQAERKNLTDVSLLVLKQGGSIPNSFYDNQLQNLLTVPLNLEDNMFSQLHKIEQSYLGCRIGTVWRVSKQKQKITLIHNIKQRQVTIKQLTLYRRGHKTCDYLLIIPKGYPILHKKAKNDEPLGILKITTSPQLQKQLKITSVNLIQKNYLQTFQALIEEKGYQLSSLNSKDDFLQDWNDILEIIVSEQHSE